MSLLLPRGRRGPGRGGCIVKRGSVYPLPNPPPARPSQGEGDIRRNAEHILRRGRRHERMSGSKPCVPSGDQQTSADVPTQFAQRVSPSPTPRLRGRSRFGTAKARPSPSHVLSVLAAPVAQTFSLLVSVEIVAGRDEFRSAAVCEAPTAARWNVPSRGIQSSVPAGPRPLRLVLRTQPRSVWLRLRRSALYRRFLTFLTCQVPLASSVLPITNRRYRKLKICTPVNRYFSSGKGRILSCRTGGFLWR